jgi:hypothetical protein
MYRLTLTPRPIGLRKAADDQCVADVGDDGNRTVKPGQVRRRMASPGYQALHSTLSESARLPEYLVQS